MPLTSPKSTLSRRAFIARSGAAGLGFAAVGGLGVGARCLEAAEPSRDGAELVSRIKDGEIRVGVEVAIRKNLMSAAGEAQYPAVLVRVVLANLDIFCRSAGRGIMGSYGFRSPGLGLTCGRSGR
jgi:hypothetical protein